MVAVATVATLDERADRIRELMTRCVIHVGRELIEAKSECRHGEWFGVASRRVRMD
jgi:hypothetical protein